MLPSIRIKSLSFLYLAALTSVLFLSTSGTMMATDGHVLHGVGPVNQSMGGAATGVCLDPTGSIAWNPACTAVFAGKSLDISAEYFIPWRQVRSSVQANAFGPGFPQANLSGTTKSATNAAILPNFAFIKRDDGSKIAIHFGLLGVAGFGVDYPASTDFSNPILTPQPPNGLGFGAIESNYALMKFPIGISYALSERASIGVSAVPAFAMLKVIPSPFAAPEPDPESGFPQYVSSPDSSNAFGIGFNAGFQYLLTDKIRIGAAYHSPVWFQKFKWDAGLPGGSTREIDFRLDFPATITAGVGINVTESTILAFDARWINYESTTGFKGSGFNPDGSVRGFGWENIWTVGFGVQQALGNKTRFRVGYNWSDNPIPDELTFFNVPAPAIVQHHLGAGVSRDLTETWTLNFSYYHAFLNEGSGPYINPMMGAVPGTMITSRLRENSISFGVSRRF
jgi:long-chain fatty acid transport protein